MTVESLTPVSIEERFGFDGNTMLNKMRQLPSVIDSFIAEATDDKHIQLLVRGCVSLGVVGEILFSDTAYTLLHDVVLVNDKVAQEKLVEAAKTVKEKLTEHDKEPLYLSTIAFSIYLRLFNEGQSIEPDEA